MHFCRLWISFGLATCRCKRRCGRKVGDWQGKLQKNKKGGGMGVGEQIERGNERDTCTDLGKSEQSQIDNFVHSESYLWNISSITQFSNVNVLSLHKYPASSDCRPGAVPHIIHQWQTWEEAERGINRGNGETNRGYKYKKIGESVCVCERERERERSNKNLILIYG